MTELFNLRSPLTTKECYQQLEILAEKRHFHFSSGNIILHIKIVSLEFKKDGFTLYISISSQRFKLPAFIFIRIIGSIRSLDEGTVIQHRHKLSWPFSIAEWGYLLFWLLLIGLALVGGIIKVLSSNLTQGFFIHLAFITACIGYAWMLFRTYKFGLVKVLDLLSKTLQQDSHAKSQGLSSKTPDWISSLSE